jgi:hypothetical protein
MNNTLLKLKENFGEGIIKVNLSPVDSYYFDRNIDQGYVEEKLSHLSVCGELMISDLMTMALTIFPDLDISLLDGSYERFMNDFMKLISDCQMQYAGQIKIDGASVTLQDGSPAHQTMYDGLFALNENYEAVDRIEEGAELDDIVDRDMDDNDVTLAYNMATKRNPSNPEEARKFIKDAVLSNPNGQIARVLSSNFLKNYSFKEALEEVPEENIMESQKKGMSLFECKGKLGKIERYGKSYRITKFKF